MVHLLRSIYSEDFLPAVSSLPANNSHEDALSGTKQAAHNWWKELTAALKDFGLIPAVDEETIFVTADNGSKDAKLIIITFVDDLLIIHNDDKLFHCFVAHLKKHFEITDEGVLNWYLGVHSEKSEDGLRLKASQQSYIEKMEDRCRTCPRSS
eukprot:701108-Rhodomonas_salina.1